MLPTLASEAKFDHGFISHPISRYHEPFGLGRFGLLSEGDTRTVGVPVTARR